MMLIERYGMRLEALRPEQLEQVRGWRNAPHVRSQMAYREEISAEAHAEWYAGLDARRNLYMVFSHLGREIGVVHLKDIDWDAGTAEAGVFVGDETDTGSPYPVYAVLALMDLAFLGLGLGKLKAKMRADHLPILEFNQRLGYVPAVHAAEDGFLYMEVDSARYLETALPLREVAAKYGGVHFRVDCGEGHIAHRVRANGWGSLTG